MTKPLSILLASKSAIRKQVLTGAGIAFTAADSRTDEDTIKSDHFKSGLPSEDLPLRLAIAKAKALGPKPGAVIIGADQIMEMDGQVFDKPKSMRDAKARLLAMRGKPHRLIGAVCTLDPDGKIWSHTSMTKLWVREFSDAFLDSYIAAEGEELLYSVGAYKFEGRGAQLFSRVEGDFFSILGLPLLPLLGQLRSMKVIPV